MAGHSKWANIKHRKSGQDQKRGKIFTKLIREITVAAKSGLPDVQANPRLRTAVDNALSHNMPRDTIDRAIKRGSGDDDTSNLEEVRYEGYGPGGVAIIVDCMTDNRNRTVGEVRHVFTKYGGNLGVTGSVTYLFKTIGQIILDGTYSEAEVLDLAVEAQADNVFTNAEAAIEIWVDPALLHDAKGALEKAGLKVATASMAMIPDNYIVLEKEELKEEVVTILEKLEELDDVQEVHTNADLDFLNTDE